MRDYAEANRGVITKITAIFSDFSKALDERPAAVLVGVGGMVVVVGEGRDDPRP